MVYVFYLHGLTVEQMVVEFKIHGTGTLYGDGFALWLTEERAKPGNVFGSTDHFTGLGIVIDTYKNNRPGTVFPYVMAMLGDGKTTYDKHNDGKANELAGCSVSVAAPAGLFLNRHQRLTGRHFTGPWHPQRQVSDQDADHVLPGQVPCRGHDVQGRRRVDDVFHARECQHPEDPVPRLLRRDW